MIKFNFFKPQMTAAKKPQTTVLRGRVALAITEDIDMQERMFKNATYKHHFYNLGKSSHYKFIQANGNRVKENEGNEKFLDYTLKELSVFLTRINLLKESCGIKVAKETYQKEFRNLACRATNQHIRNYENLKDEHKISDRVSLKALAIDSLPLFRLNLKARRKPDLRISKTDLSA